MPEISATTGEIALAWLLAGSPVTLPIPGTARAAHLEEDVAAGDLHLGAEEIEAITAAVFAPSSGAAISESRRRVFHGV